MTTGQSTSSSLAIADREALAWFVRNQVEADADPAFDAWCAVDPRHEQAYERVEQLWGSDALGAAASKLKTRRAASKLASVALSMALLFCAGVTTLKLQGIAPGLPADHATRIGEFAATTTLEDGTRVTLDSGTAIDVDYSDDARRVKVRSGRVFVAVAPDARPFSITSRDAVIHDIGTSFSVDRRGDGTMVAVRDGEIELRPSEASDQRRRVLAGQRGGLSRSGFLPVEAGDDLQDFGWTQRRLYFSDRPLREVVAELRRYHRGWIVLGDDRIAAMRISGGLRLDDPAAGMAELARLSGGRLTRVSDAVLILR